MYRCSSCNVAYLDPRPDHKSIGLAYKTYYTHQVGDKNNSQFQNLKLAMMNGYRNMKFDVELIPSSKLGILYFLFPNRKKDLDSEMRGLQKFNGNKKANILDVGCGSGVFLAIAKMMGWHTFGVEPDPIAANTARDMNVEILGSFLHEIPEEYNGYFDVITLKHVIEHVHDPLDMIKKCHQLLRRGGRLWIETPNINSQGYKRYGKFWRGLEAPRHLMIFNWISLKGLLKKAGFTEIRREVSRPMCKWMFKQSLAKNGTFNSDESSLIGTMKFRLIVFWSNLLARIDPSIHELICINAKK
ncbi:MAG: class I SAM-dependent methyltransferase [Bacteroidetes bacterium]|nr:class I SAM-dependent methyltransferase [Bacteroidota bacterium]